MNRITSQKPPSVPYGPLQRRLLGLAGLLSTLIIGLAVFHVLHTGETGLNAVAEAAERTSNQPGAKLAIEMTIGVEGSPTKIVGSGSGDFNARSGRTEFRFSIPIPGHSPVQMQGVGTETMAYMRSPLFAGELPDGKEWLGMEPLLGTDSQTALGSNGSAKSTLDMLKATGSGAEKVGDETVRGHLTTRYKGTIEPARVVELMRENGEDAAARTYEVVAERAPAAIPVEVWIDERGLARQIEMTETIPSPAGPAATVDMRMQFFAFGSHPKIKLPPKHAVFDMTPVLRAELGLDDGSTLGSLTPPAGAKPLRPAAFHRRATGICGALVGKLKGVLERGMPLAATIKRLAPAGPSAEGRADVRAYAEQVVEPGYRLLRRGTRKLARLAPPAALAGDYAQYVKLDAEQTETILAGARAWEIGQTKLPGLEAQKAASKQRDTERKQLAKRLGISSCERESTLGGGAATTPA
jgi:hypothetical protein